MEFYRTPKFENNHEYVDLGLSVKWAFVNVGAQSASDVGSYLAWCEKETKRCYSYSTAQELKAPLKDPVNLLWGGRWITPTKEQYEELLTLCNCQWAVCEGKNGMLVTRPEYDRNSFLFFPAGECAVDMKIYKDGLRGNYWTRSLIFDMPCFAHCMEFEEGGQRVAYNLRSHGFNVRPVFSDKN